MLVNMFLAITILFCVTIAQNLDQKLNPYSYNTENWTSCEEFLNNSYFDPHSVLDRDWRVFYFWNYAYEETYIVKFSLPSKLMIERFKMELDHDISPPVNWSRAELFMETSINFNALYIQTDTNGQYRLIPSAAFGMLETDKLPEFIYGLKLVEPGYLGILNCEFRLCIALAPEDKIPRAEELTTAASKLGFYNDYGRSYLIRHTTPAPIPSPFDNLDDDRSSEEIF